MWEYILASTYRDQYGDAHVSTIPELVAQYNRNHTTAFVGQADGWIRGPDSVLFHIKTLDGMCGVLVAHKLSVASEQVPTVYPLLEWMAKNGNYTFMMMSNVTGPRLNAWKAQGFTTMHAFRNRRTNNLVELLIKPVPH